MTVTDIKTMELSLRRKFFLLLYIDFFLNLKSKKSLEKVQYDIFITNQLI